MKRSLFTKKVNIFLIVLFALITAVVSYAQAPLLEKTSAADQLAEQLNAINSLQAAFTQTIVDEDGALLQKTLGKLSLARPNKLYWKTHSPYEYLMITDGDVLWRYDMDLDQLHRQSLADELHNTPAALLMSDTAEIAKQYQITLLPVEAKSNEQRYRLVPVLAQSSFSEIIFTFNEKTVTKIEMVDNLAQRTVIELTDIRINQAIDDKLFEFTIPSGVDVIDLQKKS